MRAAVGINQCYNFSSGLRYADIAGMTGEFPFTEVKEPHIREIVFNKIVRPVKRAVYDNDLEVPFICLVLQRVKTVTDGSN